MLNRWGVAALPPLGRRGWGMWGAIVLLAAILRLVGLGLPAEEYFDECYYVPGAYSYLEGTKDENSVHPPLAKIQIALGIAVGKGLQKWGWPLSEEVGWRLTSALSGIGCVALTYFLAYRLGRGSRDLAALSAFLVAIDFMGLAMSRICTLDMVLAWWMLVGVAATWNALEAGIWSSKKAYAWVLVGALAWGIATACKWTGLLGAFMAWVAILFFPSRLTPSALEAQPSPSLELAHQLAKEGGGWWFKGWKRGASVALIMALMVGAVYLLSYIPQFNREGYRWWTVRNIAHAHRVMIDFRYDPQQFTHHYCSQFWAWPTVIRPVWLKFEADRQVVMSIVCFGSIVVWWPGLIYTLEFAWSGWRQKRWVWAFLAWTWLGQWLLWAGSTTGGFIYYVLPGIPLMAIILAWVVWDWQEEGQRWLVGGYLGLITLAFIAYYPFLSFMPASRELFAWLFPPSLTLWR